MTSILRFLVNMAATSAGAVAGFQTTLRAAQNLQPHPLPHQFAGLLDHPLRRQYLDPAGVLGMYGAMAGMTVLDLGCGTGLFTVPAAQMTGDHGHIHAVDLQPAMLERAESHAAEAGVRNRITFHCSGAYALSLPDNSVDLAILISTLGEIPDKPAALSEVRRVLKPSARLGVTEELLNPAYMLAGSAAQWVEEAGFRFLARTGSPFCYHAVFANEK